MEFITAIRFHQPAPLFLQPAGFVHLGLEQGTIVKIKLSRDIADMLEDFPPGDIFLARGDVKFLK